MMIGWSPTQGVGGCVRICKRVVTVAIEHAGRGDGWDGDGDGEGTERVLAPALLLASSAVPIMAI